MNALLSVAFLIIVVISFTSCSTGQPEWMNEINGVAELYCQAKHLRESRFELADSIRFTQDSLLHQKTSNDETLHRWKIKLEFMEERKIKLAETSRDLSDSIRLILYRLTDNMSLDEKRIFKDSLTIHSERINCPTLQVSQSK